MANQVIVTNTGNVQVALTPPANVQVQISRAAINTLTSVPTANFANFAGNVTASNQPNITTLGTLTALNVSGNGTINNLTVTGNLQVGNLFANNANYSNFAGQVVDNTQSNITSLGTLTSLSVSGNITSGNANLGNLVTANYFSGDGSLLTGISNINNGTSNVSIPVANSNVQVYANNQHWVFTDVGNLLLAGGNGVIQSIANSSLDPIVPNVSTMILTPDPGYPGQALVLDPTTPGHIHLRAPGSNIDEPLSNVYLGGEISSFEVGIFNGAVPNLFIHSNNKTWTFDIDGNLTLPANTFAINYANGTQVPLDGPVANANYANFAGEAFNVNASNITGTVANANYSAYAGEANTANLATFATTANSVAGANVSGEVANANYSSYANIAASANSVALANVSGIGNIANINLDGSSSNVLFGNGVFAPESTSIANANYANFAGDVVNSSQSNITSLGNLTSLTINNTVGTAPTLIFAPNGTSFTTNYAPSAGTTQLGQSSRSGTGTPANAIIRTRGTISSPLTVGTSDTVNLNTYYAYNGNTNALAATYSIRLGGSGTLNTGANAVYTGASHSWQTGNPWGDWSNLSAVSGLNTLTFNTQGSLSITSGARRTSGTSTGLLSLTDYGTPTGAEFASGIFQLKSRGNADGALSVEPNDEVGKQIFVPSNGNATATISSQIVVAVDSSYTANSAYVPMNILLQPTTNTNTRSTTAFYGNGLTSFPGNIIASNANLGNLAVASFFSGDGGLLSNITGANITGTVANATFALDAGNSNLANTANSVAVANVSGIGNIAVINLDGSSSNVLFGNGIFAPESTSIANANYANFAGDVVNSSQPNITSLGNLSYLQVSNSANSISVINQLASNAFPIVSSFANLATYLLTTQYHPNNSLSYPADRTIRSRGNATAPTTAVSGDRIFNKSSLVYNGNTNVIAVAEIHTAVGTVSNIANGSYTGGQWDMSTGNPGGDTAIPNNNSWLNSLQFNNSGTLAITPATPANSSLGQSSSALVITNYGATTANLVQVGGITFQRARGNRANVQTIQAGDHVGRSLFYCYSNGAFQTSNVAQYRVVVDSTYVANDVIVPMSHQFQTVANVGGVTTLRTTSFFANGTTALPGNINFTTSTANLLTGTSGQVALGISAGTTQGAFSVAIGRETGETNQGTQSLAVGYRAGRTNQANYALAFGDNAGANAQSEYTIAIGQYAGANLQGNNSVAFGTNAGKESQGNVSVAIGSGAATTNQAERSVAIGPDAGSNAQGAYSVAIGLNAGYNNQSTQSVALGYYAGANTQGQYSVAIGRQAGENNQGANSFALGYAAGSTNQGNNSVAIGYAAGYANQANNSIILNATGSTLDQTVANTFTVAPVRNDVANIGQVMFYNSSSKEVTYGDTISVAGSITSGNATVGTSGSGNIASFRLFGDKTYNSNFILNGAQFNAIVDGINPFSGFSPFKFDIYDNSNNYIPPSRYFRARGSVASPASAQAGDNISINSYAVYADSGNTYKDLFNTTVAVVSNDNAGNVVGSYNIINYGGANSYVNINVPTTYAQNLIANANVTAANVQVNTNGFMKLASYTEAALTAITGQIGWMAAVSDSASGGNPNGMIAFWDTTNSRWSYIHDNSAV